MKTVQNNGYRTICIKTSKILKKNKNVLRETVSRLDGGGEMGGDPDVGGVLAFYSCCFHILLTF